MPKLNATGVNKHTSRNMVNQSTNEAKAFKQNLAKKRHVNALKNEPPQKKRVALKDLTNAIGKTLLGNHDSQSDAKHEKAKLKMESLGILADVSRIDIQSTTVTSSQGTISSSQESTTSEKYVTASEESPGNIVKMKNPKNKAYGGKVILEEPRLPDGVTDIDKENKDDHLMAAEYAMDIFAYYKEREEKFLLTPYMQNQPGVTRHMRAILVDWLVELQENLELNHETLYLAVKLMDQYLEKQAVPKERLQLLGATTVLISCKYEERLPPPISDFLYVCDNAYTKEDILELEMDILETIDFELGAPLSYRFLRRYSRSAKLSMNLLTLARYVLEVSLHDYGMVFERESLKAAAALYLALRMKDLDWSPQLQYYSGYTTKDLLEIARRLNAILHNPYKNVNTVRNKYSHRVFFEVAKVPLLPENCPSLQEEMTILTSNPSSPIF